MTAAVAGREVTHPRLDAKTPQAIRILISKNSGQIGQELDPSSPYAGVYQPNHWPEELPEFKAHMLSIYAQLEALG